MLNKFIKVENLPQEKQLRLNDDYRYFVSGQSGQAGFKEWKVLPYRSSQIIPQLLLATYALGDVTLEVCQKIVRFRQGANDLWIIDTGRFAGKPKLTVQKEGDNIEIRLTGARFPGTSIPADCDLSIFPHPDGYYIKISFLWGGFQAEVHLEQWLKGAREAVSSLLRVDEVCQLNAVESIHLNGSPAAKFFPSWIFAVSGVGAACFKGDGGDIAADVLALGLLGEGMPSLIPNHPVRRTWIGIANPKFEKKFSFPLLTWRKDGWSFGNDAPIHNAMAIEAGEWLRQIDPIRRVLVVTGAPSSILKFQPGADPIGDNGAPFAIELTHSVYAAGYDGEGTRLAAGLLARIVKHPCWLHTRFCSLLLGPARRDWLLLAESNNAVFLGHPQLMLQNIFGLAFPLLATAARPGGVTADPAPYPSTTIVGLTLTAPESVLPPNFAEIRFEPGNPSALIQFPADFWTVLVRPRDLLVLACHFVNLRLISSGQGPPRLVREGTGFPVMVVYHQPQSIGEEAIPEKKTEEDQLPPGKPPIEARMAGCSRLAFNIIGNDMPFTLENLLAWGGASPYLTSRLAPAAQNLVVLPGPGESYPQPAPEETAIEAPFRLFISPERSGVWKSRALPYENNGHTELWHTRLEDKNGVTPRMRAIWTSGGDQTPFLNPFEMSLEPSHRGYLVRQSVPEPFEAKRFMLSSLGAWLDLEGKWEDYLEHWQHRATLGRDHYVKVVQRGYALPLGHRFAVFEITERKFQKRIPGIKWAWLRKRWIIVIREPERSYRLPPETDMFQDADFRRKMPFSSIRIVNRVTPLLEQPILMEKVKADADPELNSLPADSAFWPMVSGENGAPTAFRFHLIGTDANGRIVEFFAPLAFVKAKEKDLPPDSPKHAQYAKLVDLAIDDLDSGEQKNSYSFGGSNVAYVPSMAGAPAETALETQSITFSADPNGKYPDDTDPDRPFNPIVVEAGVQLEVLRKLGNFDKTVKVIFSDHYLAGGFGNGNEGQVYLRLQKGEDLVFNASNRPDKVGGVLSPGMKVCGMSRSIGAFGANPPASAGNNVTDAELADIAAGRFNPSSYFGQGMPKLLGAIDLAAILQDAHFCEDTKAFLNSPKAPRWVSAIAGDEKVYRLHWVATNLQKDSQEIFVPGTGAALNLNIEARVKGSGEAISVLTGSLKNFAIHLGGVIQIAFKELTFRMPPGGKPEVTVKIAPPGVTFDGALRFITALQSSLGLENFGDPPSLDVTADGITAGYSIRVPSVAVGAFGLQNLAVSAGMNLPFTGQPLRANFDISERHNPFLVTVSLFTGGGFLGLTVGPDGVQRLEASLEFGGSFSLNLGVASGGVYVMAGIYFKYELGGNPQPGSDGAAVLSGYFRAGGALEVLCLVSVSVEFYLAFTYESSTTNRVWGEASMTVKVEVLFFSKSVSLTVRREIAGGSRDIRFQDMMGIQDWNDYWGAFAP